MYKNYQVFFKFLDKHREKRVNQASETDYLHDDTEHHGNSCHDKATEEETKDDGVYPTSSPRLQGWDAVLHHTHLKMNMAFQVCISICVYLYMY